MPLPSPVSAVAVERWAGRFGRAAAASMQGLRDHFEDSYHVSLDQRTCGVYDGHLGDAAAAFAAARLPLHVESSGKPTSRSSLLRAYGACDRALQEWLPVNSESGTTATFAKVDEEINGSFRILVASAGDSRSLLFHASDDTIESTADHRPSDPGEKSRIEAAGGIVDEDFDPPRIDGKLACSRALGAFKFKEDKGRPPEAQKVSSEPVIYEWQAKVGDFLLLGCDGIFDTFNNERVVKEVCRSDSTADLGERLENLLRLCLVKEADDNMTILAIQLGEVPAVEHSVAISPGDYLREKDKVVLQHYESFCKRFGWALTKEIVPKAPPRVALTAVEPEPGPDRFSGLPPLEAALLAQEPPPVRELRPLVVVGPSGVGKGTLVEALMQRFPERFGFSVSHTTRPPRPGEVDGKHYHFTDVDAMSTQIAADAFIEHAKVHSNLYGTSKAAVEAVKKTGKICILDIDVQGARQVKAREGFDAYYLGITAPTFEEMEARLRGRGTETEEKIQLRLKNAREELAYIEAPGVMDLIVRNDTVTRAARQLTELMREWYPSLVRKLRVSAKRPSSYYSKLALEYLEGSEADACQQVDIIGVASAMTNAANVVAEMERLGHEVWSIETSYDATKLKSGKESRPVPQLRVTMLRRR
mmetsp:Transcript_73229/g.136847  ORF Transcript_73229/g.136847 Transcript_73229/m.136847 type:complete len:645 (-) Transcript_73229:102-2036(-)